MTYPITGRLPQGDAGAFHTLGYIRSWAREAAAAFPGRCLWPNLSQAQRAAALRDWLRVHTSYKPDPPGCELMFHPGDLLQRIARGGAPVPIDCEDTAALGAAVALACNLPVRFRLVRLGGPGSPFGHIFAEVLQRRPDGWLDLDVHRPAALPGLLPGLLVYSEPLEL